MLQAPTNDQKTKAEASSKTAEHLSEQEQPTHIPRSMGRFSKQEASPTRRSDSMQQRENLTAMQNAYGNQAVLRGINHLEQEPPGTHQNSQVQAKTKASSMGGNVGQPIPSTLLSDLEQKFQTSLSMVRIHDNPNAAKITRQHKANAITIGDDIYFGKGRYRHDSQGQQLLAHEITHVLQQRTPGSPSPMNSVEAEARAFAQQSIRTSALPPVQNCYSPNSAAPLLDAVKLKAAFEDELDDLFFKAKNIWPSIRAEPQSDRDQIRQDKVLERNVRRRASEMELLKTYLLLTYQSENLFPPHFKAFIEATDILGTHEARIYSILRGVTSTERTEMQNMPGVVEVIEDEMSGNELQLALNLLYEGVEKAGSGTSAPRTSVHLEIVKRYELDVIAAEGKFDDVEQSIEAAFEQEGGGSAILADTSLWSKLTDHFNLEEVWYLRMITRFGKKEALPKLPKEPEPYVEVIWKAVKGWGTKEDKLIDELTNTGRSPNDRKILLDEPLFVPMLEDELSGSDLRNALKAISTTGSTAVGIRDALEDAIDDKDMRRIEKLLTDPKLSQQDRDNLSIDPVILDEIGEELNGIQLCETVLWLKYGNKVFPSYVAGLLTEFKKTPVNIKGAETFLTGLPEPDRANLLSEPGVYFLLSNSGFSPADAGKLLAAIRLAKTPSGESYREPGAEGRFITHTERVTTDVPVEFTTSEIRVTVRFNIDTSKLIGDYKLKSSTLEDWARAIDEIWNGKFQLRSNSKAFPLVFVLYMAEAITSSRLIQIYNRAGRSYQWSGNMYLYLEGTTGDGLEPITVAHEFGHVLGNPDEYALTPSEYKRFTGKTSTKPATTVAGLMGSQYLSTQVEKRHAEPITEIVNQVRDTTKYPNPFVLVKV